MTDKAAETLSGVRHVVLVLSGKGGVGKSSMTVQLAQSLVLSGKRVGILDVDLCGPSIPQMLGLGGHAVHQCSEGWVPVFADSERRLSVMSIAFLLGNSDEPVVWRGPKKSAMIKQFLEDVCWGELDYLLVDTPPGTSDEHLAVVENLRAYRPDGAVLVTTPQGVALADVRREANFCTKARIPILGIIENMSGFVCPTCKECSSIFSAGGGERLAAECAVPFLGSVPIDPALGRALEDGTTAFLKAFTDSPTAEALRRIVAPVLELPAR